jgi:hypothetical protein
VRTLGTQRRAPCAARGAARRGAGSEGALPWLISAWLLTWRW